MEVRFPAPSRKATGPARSITFTGGLVLVLALGACAAGSAESARAASSGDLSQFLLGIWHGIIAPVTLILEVINRLAPHALPWTAHFYEAKATGVVYDIGFYIGLAGSPVAILSGWSRRRR